MHIELNPWRKRKKSDGEGGGGGEREKDEWVDWVRTAKDICLSESWKRDERLALDDKEFLFRCERQRVNIPSSSMCSPISWINQRVFVDWSFLRLKTRRRKEAETNWTRSINDQVHFIVQSSMGRSMEEKRQMLRSICRSLICSPIDQRQWRNVTLPREKILFLSVGCCGLRLQMESL